MRKKTKHNLEELESLKISLLLAKMKSVLELVDNSGIVEPVWVRVMVFLYDLTKVVVLQHYSYLMLVLLSFAGDTAGVLVAVVSV